MKTIKTYKNLFLSIVILFALTMVVSCSDDEGCGYETTTPDIPVGCIGENELDLSTGIDTNGNVIAPGSGVTDPFWRVLNNPPLISCTNPLVSSINGDAYVINYGTFGPNDWVNQTGATTLAPMDLGTTSGFGCNNADNSFGDRVPYVFERSFCLIQDACIDFNFTFKGDDQIYFELIDNVTNNVVPSSLIGTSNTYVWTGTPIQTWSASNECLTAGSYSIRGYLVNTNATVLGFSMIGSLTTSNGDLALSNNADGCCENNVISVLNIIDNNCNSMFDSSEQLANGWTFNLKDASNTIIRTEITDANGNIFFAGLADGTYTVEIVPQTGYTSNPTSITVTVTGNSVEIVEFYNCP